MQCQLTFVRTLINNDHTPTQDHVEVVELVKNNVLMELSQLGSWQKCRLHMFGRVKELAHEHLQTKAVILSQTSSHVTLLDSLMRKF